MNRVEHLAEGVTLICGDCREVMPGLGKFDKARGHAVTISYLIHAKSEAEAAALAALGWTCSDDHLMTHHNVYSLRYRWEGDGDPPLPESMKARAP